MTARETADGKIRTNGVRDSSIQFSLVPTRRTMLWWRNGARVLCDGGVWQPRIRLAAGERTNVPAVFECDVLDSCRAHHLLGRLKELGQLQFPLE